MSGAVRDLAVIEEIFDKKSPKINLQGLAKFFNVNDSELAYALRMDPSALSKNPLTTPKGAIKQWLKIFNMITQIIDEAEPGLSNEEVKLKMQRWLHLPRPELDYNSPLEYMFKGKSRKVLMLLEQLLV